MAGCFPIAPLLDPSSSVISLPFEDGLVVVSPSEAVYVLDAAGRQLWDALQLGCGVDELVAARVRETGAAARVVRAQLLRALASWRKIGLLEASPRTDPCALAPTASLVRPARPEPALDAVYLVGDRPVRVRCDDDTLGRLIEAACAPFRTDGVQTATCVDLIESDGRFAVHAERAALTAAPAPTDNPASARHRCLTALLEAAHWGRRWLGILHAAAVAEGGRCLLLPGESGSGKSTLLAAMVATGASFVTDDYAPLEQGTWLVWPVPYAPSLKRGCWRLLGRHYPALRTAPVHRHRGLQIRYLELDEAQRAPLTEGLPAAALVFPRYERGAALKLRRVTATEALAGICHAASILDRRPEVLAETLRWIRSVPAFELSYGELDAAVGQARALLHGEHGGA